MHRGGDAGEWRGVGVEAVGDEGGAPGGGALGQEEGIEPIPVGAVGGGHIDVVDAIHLQVDEPGGEHLHIGAAGARRDGGDQAVGHLHRSRADPPSGGEDPLGGDGRGGPMHRRATVPPHPGKAGAG